MLLEARGRGNVKDMRNMRVASKRVFSVKSVTQRGGAVAAEGARVQNHVTWPRRWMVEAWGPKYTAA
jgi:hypothetical protein